MKLPQFVPGPDNSFTPTRQILVVRDDERGRIEDVIAKFPYNGDDDAYSYWAEDNGKNYDEHNGTGAIDPPMKTDEFAERLRTVMVEWYARTSPDKSPEELANFGRMVSRYNTLLALTRFLFEFYDRDYGVIVPQLLAAANVEVKRQGFWLEATA